MRIRHVLEDDVAGEGGKALLAEVMTAPPGGWPAAIKKPNTLPRRPQALHSRSYPDESRNQERTLSECILSSNLCQGLAKRPNPFSLIEI
jgi:hypothetical protein